MLPEETKFEIKIMASKAKLSITEFCTRAILEYGKLLPKPPKVRTENTKSFMETVLKKLDGLTADVNEIKEQLNKES
jgi:hypothetical protein